MEYIDDIGILTDAFISADARPRQRLGPVPPHNFKRVVLETVDDLIHPRSIVEHFAPCQTNHPASPVGAGLLGMDAIGEIRAAFVRKVSNQQQQPIRQTQNMLVNLRTSQHRTHKAQVRRRRLHRTLLQFCDALPA